MLPPLSKRSPEFVPDIDDEQRRAARQRRRLRDRCELSRAHAFGVLGLSGTGALHPILLHGVVRIRRGGVWLFGSMPRRLRFSL